MALTGDPEEDDASALAYEPGRELDGCDGPGRLHDDIETTADESPRLALCVALSDVHHGICTESER